MNRTPTGTLLLTSTGRDLLIQRRLRAPVDDVWASITESERTACWFGPWRGHAAPGTTIEVQMAYEEGQPWSPLHIDACEAPHRLAVTMLDEYGHWRVELLLSESDGTTELRLVHHLDHDANVGEVGPGWEYYLDMLVAARDGTPQPTFDDYFPSMTRYFQDLTATPAE
jgi:uncharacterized protein YndB with AHSA1/START domain